MGSLVNFGVVTAKWYEPDTKFIKKRHPSIGMSPIKQSESNRPKAYPLHCSDCTQNTQIFLLCFRESNVLKKSSTLGIHLHLNSHVKAHVRAKFSEN